MPCAPDDLHRLIDVQFFRSCARHSFVWHLSGRFCVFWTGTFQINGRRVFARGANWLPCDMRISECTEADYEYLLGAAADSNMNFIRVWGGGGVEKQAFYDAADRHGIMIYRAIATAPLISLSLVPSGLSPRVSAHAGLLIPSCP